MGKNYTIYIATPIDIVFNSEVNKSGLINDLLAQHYKQQAAVKPAVSLKPANLPGQLSIDELPCCANTARCKHWSWDGEDGVWTNSLSGRKVEA